MLVYNPSEMVSNKSYDNRSHAIRRSFQSYPVFAFQAIWFFHLKKLNQFLVLRRYLISRLKGRCGQYITQAKNKRVESAI